MQQLQNLREKARKGFKDWRENESIYKYKDYSQNWIFNQNNLSASTKECGLDLTKV